MNIKNVERFLSGFRKFFSFIFQISPRSRRPTTNTLTRIEKGSNKNFILFFQILIPDDNDSGAPLWLMRVVH
jgi:hypothetical protein